MGVWERIGSFIGGFTNWWNTLNIGNLSEAAAAAASLLVVLVTLGITLAEVRRLRRSELVGQLERLQMKQVQRRDRVESVSLVVNGNTEDGRVQLMVYNKSHRPINRAYLVKSDAEVDMADLSIARILDAEPIFWVGVVAAGESFDGAFEAAVTGVHEEHEVAMLFDDIDGNTWWLHAAGGLQLAIDLSILGGGKTTEMQAEIERLDPITTRLSRWRESRTRNRRAR